jgi:hypothetical protein
METNEYHKQKNKILNSKRKSKKQKDLERLNLWFSYIFSKNTSLIIIDHYEKI